MGATDMWSESVAVWVRKNVDWVRLSRVLFDGDGNQLPLGDVARALAEERKAFADGAGSVSGLFCAAYALSVGMSPRGISDDARNRRSLIQGLAEVIAMEMDREEKAKAKKEEEGL